MSASSVRIGLDLDNTIVSYDELFHRVAVERQLVPDGLPATKLSVRDHLRHTNSESLWTELQGYVYGARMSDAVAYPGVVAFLRRTRAAGAYLAIVSHRTHHPFAGASYDLHQAAREWIDACLVDAAEPLVESRNTYFELTKADKLARIASLGLNYFVDDLPEFLLAEAFPAHTVPILLDPDGTHRPDARLIACADWDQVAARVGAA